MQTNSPQKTKKLPKKVLALVAMEQPVSCHPDDIRDEKCRVLRCIAPVKQGDCILGQYVAGRGQPGYLDDPTVRVQEWGVGSGQGGEGCVLHVLCV
jgi:hypothetical protein